MINEVILTGRLVASPELKATQSGASVCSFSLAVERDYKDANGAKLTDFIDCVAWRGTAEFICRYFEKGDMIGLCGEIQTRKYQDKDGNPRTAFEIKINKASFCGGKRIADDSNAPHATPADRQDDNEDNLPF